MYKRMDPLTLGTRSREALRRDFLFSIIRQTLLDHNQGFGVAKEERSPETRPATHACSGRLKNWWPNEENAELLSQLSDKAAGLRPFGRGGMLCSCADAALHLVGHESNNEHAQRYKSKNGDGNEIGSAQLSAIHRFSGWKQAPRRLIRVSRAHETSSEYEADTAYSLDAS